MGQQKIRVDQIQDGDEGTGGWNKLAVWKDNFDKVRKIVDSMQPDKMHSGALAYKNMATRMDTSVNLIYKQATRLVEAWGGEDANKAMVQMDKAFQQAKEIYTRADTTSKALTAHGNQQTTWKQQYGSGSATDSWVNNTFNWGMKHIAVSPVAVSTFIGNNMAADDAMDAIHEGTRQSNQNFPEGIRQDMPTTNPNVFNEKPPPNTGKPPGSPEMPGGGPPPGSPNGDIPKGSPDIPKGSPDLPGGPPGPGDRPPGGPGDLPGGPGGPGDLPGGPGGVPGGGGTDLASLPGGGPGGGPGLGGGGMPGGGPGGAPSMGAGGLGGAPAGLGTGAGGMLGGPGAMGAGRGGMGKGGMTGMGMPMGAGAGGRGGDGNEHERSTWLTEDEDVWGGDDDTAPPVIG
ncbi:hypothetical protein E1264_27265 [Actinomadura sp. KC216]|uniref:hypothetical protein n=1 Tax=Actinomadura sp. KC216 TaxID=2530370 RepID=UPI0010435CD1|nr:hypothetical protein [Actinomadura sp. KC216]TDB83725.1 hypothetical protein E1264_27265 [Actinomadura sp. KC216]